MEINFLGDSITEGALADNHSLSYTALVCNHFGAKENNFAVSGTRIAEQMDSENDLYGEHFLLRARRMPQNADFTFVFGGTNDYGHGDAPLGNQGDKSPFTFYGAFSRLVEYMLENFKREKICFILPLPRYNQNDPRGEGTKKPIAPLSEYIKIERKLLEHYNINYLDLSEFFPEPSTNKPTELLEDGLHPNNKGHRLIADKLIDFLRKI